MSLLSRIQRGVRLGLEAVRGVESADQIVLNLDQVIADPNLEAYLQSTEEYITASKKTKSKLDTKKTSDTVISFYSLLSRAIQGNELPAQGDPTRDIVLADFWEKSRSWQVLFTACLPR